MGASSRSDHDGLPLLLSRIRACRICRDAPEGIILPHEPRPVLRVSASARLLIAGQAPGTRVHQSGTPFTDPSGDRLRQWMGVDPDTFYDASRIAIVPMGFCFPGLDAKGSDLPPRRECSRTWHDPLFSALPEMQLVLAIGAYAQRYHLARLGLTRPRGETVSGLVANWRDLAQTSPRVIPLPHPSWRNSGWLRKNPWFERDLVPELQRCVARAIG